MKIIATVEARMASTRLPGKVMLDLLDKPVLYRVVERISQAKSVKEVVVATSVNPADDIIADYCQANGISYYRGTEDDVLKRVVEAAAKFRGEIVVQLGADNPFYDPNIIDQLVNIYLNGDFDYVCNDLEPTYLNGVDVHVVSLNTLKDVMARTDNKLDREDVVRYIWEHPEQYRILNIRAPRELYAPDIRLTLDHEEDYTVIVKVFEALYLKNQNFRTRDIINYLESHPEIKNINAHCEQKSAPYVPREKAEA
jgi:spore coat polysaccharide biosynthesis protein SpsF (cytidylyltransferase family)